MANGQNNESISPQAKALSLYIQSAVENLKASSSADKAKDKNEQSSLIYLGNWQDPYPRLLVTDPVLEPVDKLVWQIIRLHISAPGAVTAFPNYETLCTYANIRSNHTVSRALAILRATRWLSLCARVRDGRGRYLGNIYVLHDEPVTLGDAMYLDTEYMTFLQTGIEHSHPRVRKIVENVAATISEMVDDGLDVMGERIQTWSYERRISVVAKERSEPALQLTERTEFYAISDSRINTLTQDGQDSTQILHSDKDSDSHVQYLHTVKPGEPDHVQKTHTDQQPENTHVQNLHMDQTHENSLVQKLHMDENSENGPVKKLHTDVLRSSNINTTTTSSNTPRTREAESLHFPDRISANERELAMMYLNPIGDDQQQDVLDEWNGRLTAANRRSTPIENPIGYLASLCRRVKTGEFQITIGLRVRENRERESRRAVEEKRRGEKERKKQEELVQSLQERAGSTGKSNIQRRMEQISKKRKNNGKQQPTE
ncbi:MAG: hypothetical protein COB33_005605 [Thiotrichaceae bacterium]|nr:hypothetical protein [Thiotrichaceae bacterium]